MPSHRARKRPWLCRGCQIQFEPTVYSVRQCGNSRNFIIATKLAKLKCLLYWVNLVVEQKVRSAMLIKKKTVNITGTLPITSVLWLEWLLHTQLPVLFLKQRFFFLQGFFIFLFHCLLNSEVSNASLPLGIWKESKVNNASSVSVWSS